MTRPDDEADRPTPPELLRAYTSTHCVLVHDGVRSLLAGPSPLPLPSEPLYVITAENPGSMPLAEAENAERNAELEAALRVRGWTVWRAHGEAADGSWAETGYAVAGASRDAVVALGGRFGQRAVFELDDADQRIVGCLGLEQGQVLATRRRDWGTPCRGGAG
ncbi:MAG: DUF3293 domain-containing protein [Acidimicrobiales bacterium]|jgi:hypothetical protein|nr:DUF3293 domain-containing protein [Acidimicrobiales bacterium]